MNINGIQIPQSKVSKFFFNVFTRFKNWLFYLLWKVLLFKFPIIMRVRYQNENFKMFLIILLITFPVE